MVSRAPHHRTKPTHRGALPLQRRSCVCIEPRWCLHVSSANDAEGCLSYKPHAERHGFVRPTLRSAAKLHPRLASSAASRCWTALHLSAPLSRPTMASTTTWCARDVSWPTGRTTIDSLAVKSFPGRTKLSRGRPPSANEAVVRATADGSLYGLLVIWQSTQSAPPADATTSAGRSFEDDRSENGKRTRTTTPALTPPTLRVPLDGSSPLRATARSAGQFQKRRRRAQ